MPRLTTVALLLGLVAAALVGAAPAYAEGQFCRDQGVNVVVDFQELGGGVQRACDEQGAGKTAQQVFAESGFALTPVGGFPGAACRVDGKPADAACAKMPPADAYWGLFVGKGTTWDYAPKGADQLTVEDGDFLGFSWQSSSTARPPDADPVRATAASTEDQAPAARHQDDGGVAWWVPTLVVLALVGAGVVLGVRRRRGSAA